MAKCSVEVISDGTARYFSPEIVGDKNLVLQLLDGKGAVLSSYSVPVFFSDANSGEKNLDSVPVQLRIPFDQNVKLLQLSEKDGTILCAEVRSAKPPTVSITNPPNGGKWESISSVTWTASDPDGDSLLFDVFVAENDGMGWMKIASDISSKVYVPKTDIDATRVMVIAKDGFNSASAISKSNAAVEEVYAYPAEKEKTSVIVGPPSDEPPGDFSFMQGADMSGSTKKDENKPCIFFTILSITLLSLAIKNEV